MRETALALNGFTVYERADDGRRSELRPLCSTATWLGLRQFDAHGTRHTLRVEAQLCIDVDTGEWVGRIGSGWMTSSLLHTTKVRTRDVHAALDRLSEQMRSDYISATGRGAKLGDQPLAPVPRSGAEFITLDVLRAELERRSQLR
jgi:hypothetical protein